MRVIVLGAGMAGILATIKLKQSGYEVICYEKGNNVGGTWRENTYPGLHCDTPAHNYAYSFALNPNWSRYCAPGPEIQRYFEQTVDDCGVRGLIQLNREVVRCEYLDDEWEIETRCGVIDRATAVIVATGVLHHPVTPNIKGLENFEGDYFHTARWDHSVALDGKRIGVIGNGATGVQVVSALVEKATVKHFQRTPQWILPIPNTEYTEEQKAAFRANPQLLVDLKYDEEYFRNVKRFTTAVADASSKEIAEIQQFCERYLDESIKDPMLREKLRPTYLAACKRLIYSPDYYNAIQHPNAELITDGIEQVEAKGVRTRDGKLHEVDVLALATGFNASMFMRPMQVRGRNGVSLNSFWAKRPTAYYAISMPDFPNLFMLNGPTGPVGNFSLTEIAEFEWDYIAQLLELLKTGKYSEISVSSDAMAAYEEKRLAKAKKTVFGSGCTSWYLDAEGVPSTWPWDHNAFEDAMRKPVLEDYQLIAEPESALQ
ncbi:MAG: NAD(P)/FAD-dependent oxidoreductase [Pseudomonas sp.]